MKLISCGVFLKTRSCVIEVGNLYSLDMSTVSIVCFFSSSSSLSFDFHLGKLINCQTNDLKIKGSLKPAHSCYGLSLY